ncbi:MAG: COX aromatic rich motif-containing protein [Thiobacillus sp.]|nr:COX aromatic rich motif-containing protein [Thiobacillus sp.]
MRVRTATTCVKPWFRHALIGFAVAASSQVCGAAWAASVPVLQANGPVAAEQVGLMRDALLLMAIVVLPVFVLTGIFVWRYRKARRAAYRPDWSFSLPLEFVIWGIPACVVVAIGYLVWTRTHDLDPYSQVGSGSVLEVQAIATDWKWIFLYPDLNVATVNELVVPSGQAFRVELTSDTVMNAFFIPGLGGQMFAMAGMRTELNLRAESSAEMWGRNTQFSGSGFPAQEFRVRVVDRAGFDTWLKQVRASDQHLTRAAYRRLASHRAMAPETRYAGFDAGLFDGVVAQYASGAHR